MFPHPSTGCYQPLKVFFEWYGKLTVHKCAAEMTFAKFCFVVVVVVVV